MLLLMPGQRGPLVELQDVLREAHEAFRAERLAEIEKRNRNGAPLDDDTRWKDVAALVPKLGQAATMRKTNDVEDVARIALSLVSGNAIADPGPYVHDESIEGVAVQMAVVSDPVRRGVQARINDAARAMKRATSDAEARAADELIVEAQADLVRACVVHLGGVSVASVEGKRVPLPTIDELIPALRLAGLLVPLFLACRHFLGLDPKKALRCGLRASSTSPNSSAPPAPQRVETSSVASTMAPPFSSSTPPTSPVDVPDVT